MGVNARCLSALSLMLAMLGTHEASATEIGGGTLRVERRETAGDCPDERALRDATIALGVPPPNRTASSDAVVTFDHDEAGYVAHVEVSGANAGVREVRKPGDSCSPLAEAVTVVLALVFDLAPPEPPAALAPKPPAPVQPPPSVPPPAAPPAPAAFALGLGVSAGAADGLLGDSVVGTIGGGVRPAFGRWELSATALWAPGRTLDYLAASVQLSLLAGRLQGCGWLSRAVARPNLGFCLGALVGALRGRGHGFDHDLHANETWAALEGGAVGRLPLGPRWSIRAGISALVTTGRHEFTVGGAGTAFESSRWAGLVELGPELHFR
jgi:hypothetical protein